MSLENEVLAKLVPADDEAAAMQETARRLLAALQERIDAAGVPGQATVQGSVAKETWLAGSTDIDVFVLMDPGVPEERLEAIVRDAAEGVLEEVQAKYAQHPYLIGRHAGYDVDLVPAYAVARPGKRLSAVDRTPFHTRWVLDNLDHAARQQVRLTKGWMQGVGVYGAETAIAGFSGYLVEVLVHALGGFQGVVDWLAQGAGPRRIVVAGDDVDDLDAVLVVPDPVDAARNCAAAVAPSTLERAIEAAVAYQEEPSMHFFFPAPPRAVSGATLHATLRDRREAWLGLAFPEAAKRLDLVAPQFQKAAGRITDALTSEGFQVLGQQTDIMDPFLGMQWRIIDQPLPALRVHEGPPEGSEHARRFMDKWQDHPDTVGGIQVEDGRLRVEIAVHQRTAAAWLAEHLDRIVLGKHVDRAKSQARLVDDPADVLPLWSPAVTDFILRRRPWQR